MTYTPSPLRRRPTGLGPLVLLALLVADAALGQPAARAAAPPVAFALSLDGTAEVHVTPGAPVVAEAVLVHARALRPDAAPVALSAPGGWPAALRLDVRAADGTGVTWPFEPVRAPETAFALDGETSAGWVWTLASEATAALAPGTYEVRAVLDAAVFGPSAASVRTPPVVVVVGAAPSLATPSAPGAGPAEPAAQALRLAAYEAFRGRPAAALAHLDAALADDPANVEARYQQALLLQEVGRPAEAFGALRAALAAVPVDPAEPPIALAAAQRALVGAVATSTAFAVALAPKPAAHPLAGRGGPDAFTLDGFFGRDLVLQRGTRYTFRLAGVPATAPFVLTADPTTATAYTDGVSGSGATGDGTLTFAPGPETPSVLYYASAADPHAGGRIRIEAPDAPTDAEGPVLVPAAFALAAPTPNPTRDRAALALAVSVASEVEVAVFDVLGRRVAVLFDGVVRPGAPLSLAFDGTGLPSGVYTVRAATGGAIVTRSVTVVR